MGLKSTPDSLYIALEVISPESNPHLTLVLLQPPREEHLLQVILLIIDNERPNNASRKSCNNHKKPKPNSISNARHHQECLGTKDCPT